MVVNFFTFVAIFFWKFLGSKNNYDIVVYNFEFFYYTTIV